MDILTNVLMVLVFAGAALIVCQDEKTPLIGLIGCIIYTVAAFVVIGMMIGGVM